MSEELATKNDIREIQGGVQVMRADVQGIRADIQTILAQMAKDRELNQAHYELNDQRYMSLMSQFVNRQEIEDGRYVEFKAALADVRQTMVTRTEFQDAFTALNDDIRVFSLDQGKLGKRLVRLEKRVSDLEQRGTGPVSR